MLRPESVGSVDVNPGYLENTREAEKEAQGAQGFDKNCRNSVPLSRVWPEVFVTSIIDLPLEGPMRRALND